MQFVQCAQVCVRSNLCGSIETLGWHLLYTDFDGAYSDIVVQIVDSRNPLLFRCEDLEAYVKEVDETKVNVILINKSDFLTDQQR